MNMTMSKPVDHEAFCQGMRRLASGVSVIASIGDGERVGLTATAVCSITAEPPRLLVCVNRKVRAHDVIKRSERLTVNVLDKSQEEVARRFAGMVEGVSGADRFADEAWDTSPSGLPVLRGAPVIFDCEVIEAREMTTHTIFLCSVTDVLIGANQNSPLVYVDGRFTSIL